MILINLPEVVLEKVMSFLSFEEISQLRLVCKTFDGIGGTLLNKGFISAEKFHSQCLKSVKAQLPRRESERRTHPLAKHCDILTAVETRLSMLAMTFSKYIDLGLCCFIPGKVLDEIFKVLENIRFTKDSPRPHEVLQELRDISSMAMEHFDEKIVPILKLNLSKNPRSYIKETFIKETGGLTMAGAAVLGQVSGPLPLKFPSSENMRTEFQKWAKGTRDNRAHIGKLRQHIVSLKRQVISIEKAREKSERKVRRQGIKLRGQAVQLNKQEIQIGEMNRHFEEYTQKLADLTAELNRAREVEGTTKTLIPTTTAATCSWTGKRTVGHFETIGDEPSQKRVKFEQT